MSRSVRVPVMRPRRLAERLHTPAPKEALVLVSLTVAGAYAIDAWQPTGPTITWTAWWTPLAAFITTLLLVLVARDSNVRESVLSRTQVLVHHAWVYPIGLLQLGFALISPFLLSSHAVAMTSAASVAGLIAVSLRLFDASTSEETWAHAEEHAVEQWVADREWLSVRQLGGYEEMEQRGVRCIDLNYRLTVSTLVLCSERDGVISSVQLDRVEAVRRRLPQPLEIVLSSAGLSIGRGDLLASIEPSSPLPPAEAERALAELRRCFTIVRGPQHAMLEHTVGAMENLADSALRNGSWDELRRLGVLGRAIMAGACALYRPFGLRYNPRRGRFGRSRWVWEASFASAPLSEPFRRLPQALARHPELPADFRLATLGLAFDLALQAVELEFLLGYHFLLTAPLEALRTLSNVTERRYVLMRSLRLYSSLLWKSAMQRDEASTRFVNNAVPLLFSLWQEAGRAAIERADHELLDHILLTLDQSLEEPWSTHRTRARADGASDYARLVDQVPHMRALILCGLFAYAHAKGLRTAQIQGRLPRDFGTLLQLYLTATTKAVQQEWEWTCWDPAIDESIIRALLPLLVAAYPQDGAVPAELSAAAQTLRSNLEQMLQKQDPELDRAAASRLLIACAHTMPATMETRLST